MKKADRFAKIVHLEHLNQPQVLYPLTNTRRQITALTVQRGLIQMNLENFLVNYTTQTVAGQHLDVKYVRLESLKTHLELMDVPIVYLVSIMTKL